jgi:hypothetical protein
MRLHTSALAVLVALAMVAYAPNLGLAQSNQDASAQSSPAAPRVPQPQGGIATVIGVDQPENCLRIRSGPGSSYDVIGCADMGQQLNITGVWTSNDWAQLADNGWVYGPQIQTDLRPPQAALSEPQQTVVVQEAPPVDYNTYDLGYLPGYGYSTYWYGGVPIIVYAANVWWRHHPWWWHRNWVRNHNAWNWSRNLQSNMRPGRNFNPNTMPRRFNTTATPRSLSAANPSSVSRNFSAATRSNFSSSNMARFNTNSFRSGSANVTRSARTFSSPNTLRTFSNPSAFRMGNVGGARQFSGGGSHAFGGGGGRAFGGGGGGRHR